MTDEVRNYRDISELVAKYDYGTTGYDQKLIEKYIEYVKRQCWTAKKAGQTIGRSRQWFHDVTHGRTKKLQLSTRSKIENILREN